MNIKNNWYISDFEGAQLTVNPLSAAAMIDELQIKNDSGDFLLQSGAASALGRVVIQLAKVKKYILFMNRAKYLLYFYFSWEDSRQLM